MGHRGIEEVKNHPWLKNTDWKSLYSKKLDPPFRPPASDNYDNKVGSHLFKDSYSQKSLNFAKEILEGKVKSLEDIQNLFKDYYYDYREKDDSKISFVSTLNNGKDIKWKTKIQTSLM